MRFSVEDVQPASIDIVWPLVLPMVERGIRHGEGDTLTAGMIRHAIIDGEMSAWAVREIASGEILAVLVFRIRLCVNGRSVFVVMLAGERMVEWVDEVETMLRDYAVIVGARNVRANCRMGLSHILARRGWKRKSVIMEAP